MKKQEPRNQKTKDQKPTYDQELSSMLTEVSTTFDRYVQTERLHVSSALSVLDLVKSRVLGRIISALDQQQTKAESSKIKMFN